MLFVHDLMSLRVVSQPRRLDFCRPRVNPAIIRPEVDLANVLAINRDTRTQSFTIDLETKISDGNGFADRRLLDR